jgi:hypothetical protein
MKALIQKELRENLKVALPGFLVFTALLLNSYLSSGGPPPVNRNILTVVELVCNLFGLILGWFQVFQERNRDLWAFLIHRPLTKRRFFWRRPRRG